MADGRAIIDMLCSAGADVAAVDDAGGTPLHVASQHGHTTAALALIEHGADVNAIDTSGERVTPLHGAHLHAGEHGRMHTAATCTPCNPEYYVYVHTFARSHACTHPRACMQTFQASYVAPPPLHAVATYYGHVDVIQLLRRSGATLRKRDAAGRTAADIVKVAGYAEDGEVARALKDGRRKRQRPAFNASPQAAEAEGSAEVAKAHEAGAVTTASEAMQAEGAAATSVPTTNVDAGTPGGVPAGVPVDDGTDQPLDVGSNAHASLRSSGDTTVSPLAVQTELRSLDRNLTDLEPLPKVCSAAEPRQALCLQREVHLPGMLRLPCVVCRLVTFEAHVHALGQAVAEGSLANGSRIANRSGSAARLAELARLATTGVCTRCAIAQLLGRADGRHQKMRALCDELLRSFEQEITASVQEVLETSTSRMVPPLSPRLDKICARACDSEGSCSQPMRAWVGAIEYILGHEPLSGRTMPASLGGPPAANEAHPSLYSAPIADALLYFAALKSDARLVALLAITAGVSPVRPLNSVASRAVVSDAPQPTDVDAATPSSAAMAALYRALAFLMSKATVAQQVCKSACIQHAHMARVACACTRTGRHAPQARLHPQP